MDYMMTSTHLFPYFLDFEISDNLFSIHCPVYYNLNSKGIAFKATP